MVTFRAHAIAFVSLNGALHLANVFLGDTWWAFWPIVAWGPLFAVHYFVQKSRRVDEAWVEERTEDVRSKSYDRAHMDSIENRLADKDKR